MLLYNNEMWQYTGNRGPGREHSQALQRGEAHGYFEKSRLWLYWGGLRVLRTTDTPSGSTRFVVDCCRVKRVLDELTAVIFVRSGDRSVSVDCWFFIKSSGKSVVCSLSHLNLSVRLTHLNHLSLER